MGPDPSSLSPDPCHKVPTQNTTAHRKTARAVQGARVPAGPCGSALSVRARGQELSLGVILLDILFRCLLWSARLKAASCLLTSPSRYPPFNGKKERSIRDIKSYERAVRRHTTGTTLEERLAEAIGDLNDQRPRPVLRGRTAREWWSNVSVFLEDRTEFAFLRDNDENQAAL